MNDRIKTIKRFACGYRYFTAFKTRIYLIGENSYLRINTT
ncbi:hypothetical protein ACKN8S_00505 [Limosilactobacillus reuteri]|nr:hypothetical protein [Limosilactobacillus reuteri]